MDQMEIKQLKKENLELVKMVNMYREKFHIALKALDELEGNPDRRVASRCKEYLSSQEF
jgi:hypothetical protein